MAWPLVAYRHAQYKRRSLPSTSTLQQPPWVLYALPVLLVIGAGSVALLSVRSNDDNNHLSLDKLNIRSLILNQIESHNKHGTPHDPSLDSEPSFIPYHKLYLHFSPILGVSLLVLWLIFLFSTLGIVASDFFCPNLSTLASRLGLPEDVAGATMVGWANGAPDLFSTFASLKAGSGSLAIGELIGAASFICSVVAGSMVLVKPFRVGKFNFFRDVGFFTLAVAFTLIILRDGTIHAWEAHCMVCLYSAYVVLVAGGSYWRRRRRRQKERERLTREAWIEDQIVDGEPGRRSTDKTNGIPSVMVTTGDEGTTGPDETANDYFSSQATGDERLGHLTDSPARTPGSTRKRSATHSHSHHQNYHYPLPSPIAGRLLHRSSILGAIEFRDVVNSLQAESSANRNLHAFSSQEERDLEASTGLILGNGMNRSRSFHGLSSRAHSGKGHHRRKSSKYQPSKRSTASSSHSFPNIDENEGERIRTKSSPIPQLAPSQLPKLQISELTVDDPWKNAPVPDSRSGTPAISSSSSSINEHAAREYLENSWATTENLPTDIEASAGESDVTARPSHSPDGDEPTPASGMSQYPSKALKVLGFVPPKAARLLGPNDISSVPPKAQRILGTSDASSPIISRKPIDWSYVLAATRAVLHSLFPSMHNFWNKSILAKITSLISLPAVLLLNLTLPVVDESEGEAEYIQEIEKDQEAADLSEEGRIRLSEDDDNDSIYSSNNSQEDLEEGIEERLDQDDEDEFQRNVRMSLAVAQELHSPVATSHHLSTQDKGIGGIEAIISPGLQAAIPSLPELDRINLPSSTRDSRIHVEQEDLTKYITAIQTLLAPIFVTLALLGDQLQWWYPLIALVVGVSLSTTSVLFMKDERHITRVLSLCIIGFVVAIVWILSIVNEVVGVLQTLGHVFKLSDAILGLTIFAMGNSLGDLVANVTVARMGYPLMALSACFGGPMLNILLGIGVSGSYLTNKTGKPVTIEISKTLSLSGIALLVVLSTTLVSVPLNGFIMSRKWAIGIIAVYILVMMGNVWVEIISER